jgi:hypothetical protein
VKIEELMEIVRIYRLSKADEKQTGRTSAMIEEMARRVAHGSDVLGVFVSRQQAMAAMSDVEKRAREIHQELGKTQPSESVLALGNALRERHPDARGHCFCIQVGTATPPSFYPDERFVDHAVHEARVSTFACDMGLLGVSS